MDQRIQVADKGVNIGYVVLAELKHLKQIEIVNTFKLRHSVEGEVEAAELCEVLQSLNYWNLVLPQVQIAKVCEVLKVLDDL